MGAAAQKQYAGTIIMEIDGVEYEIKSVSPNTKTGASAVKTMNSQGRPLGTASGIKEWSLDIEAYIPLDGSEPDWDNMTGATITVYPLDPGGNREIYMGFTVEEVGMKSGVGEQATRSIKGHALNKQVA